MIELVLEAGAYGAKINGSGFGGTIVIYAPYHQTECIKSLRDAGFPQVWPAKISTGATIL